MPYFVSFLEGIITFISPCILPLLPVYIAYFLGGKARSWLLLWNTLFFVLGFTFVFVSMGIFASLIGAFFLQYKLLVQLITGGFVLMAGLYLLGVLPENIFLFKGIQNTNWHKKKQNFLSFFLFGIIFAVGWTPCLSVFLGSALMLASHQGSVLKGTVMLLCYGLGLGIPFIISAFFLDTLKTFFHSIKNHYATVNRVAGFMMILLGVLMMTGLLNRIQSLW